MGESFDFVVSCFDGRNDDDEAYFLGTVIENFIIMANWRLHVILEAV